MCFKYSDLPLPCIDVSTRVLFHQPKGKQRSKSFHHRKLFQYKIKVNGLIVPKYSF